MLLQAHDDAGGSATLFPLVYNELRALADRKIRGESIEQTLQATALVHEAYLRLIDVGEPQQWEGRSHFFAAAAEAMRRILVERARRRQRIRHGGGRQRVDIEQMATVARVDDGNASVEDFLSLSDALSDLAAEDSDAAELVKLRYFAGLTLEQSASVMDISLRTANRHWAYAKAWLYDRLNDSGKSPR
jgi:RNA polymerase sigma factor (TIGR02999 family)